MEEGLSKRTFDVNDAVELAYQGLSNYEIGAMLGVDESRIRAAFRDPEVNFSRHLVPTNLTERFLVEVDKPLSITGNVGITADFHIPLYDAEYVNSMIETFREQELETLIIAGDFLNMDSLSRFEDKQDNAGLERELQEAINVMGVLQESFTRIIYIWGNHDARIHKALGMKMQFKSAMRLIFDSLGKDVLTKIEFTNLDHVWHENEETGEMWYICHPANYTRVPLTTARVLAAKHGANVVTAHSHHCAVGYATNGVHVVAEIGGLFDRHKTGYLQRTTTFPTWTQGYAYLKNGKLRVHSPGWSLG